MTFNTEDIFFVLVLYPNEWNNFYRCYIVSIGGLVQQMMPYDT